MEFDEGILAANLNTYIRIHNITHKYIIECIDKKRKIKLSQSSISKALNQKEKYTQLKHLLIIADGLNLDVNRLLWKKLGDSELAGVLGNDLRVKESRDDVTPYEGKIFCYFYPTIKRETAKNELHYAEMSIMADESGNHVEFRMDSNLINSDNEYLPSAKVKKYYSGELFLIQQLKVCYIILNNSNNNEKTFVMFRQHSLQIKKMESCIAGVMTVSAGTKRFPVYQRMIMSRKKLSSKGIKMIRPSLLLNSKEILIEKDVFESIMQDKNLSERMRSTIAATGKKKEYYVLKEDTIDDSDISEMVRLIARLRENSYARKYLKTSEKADDLLHMLIYEEGENGIFIEND